MKNHICIIAILIVGFSGAILALNNSGNNEVQTYTPDKTKNNIRLVLVSISQGSVFSQETSADNNKTSYQVIPRIYMECLVEYLGEGELKSNSISSNPSFTKDGMPAITDSIMKDGHIWSHNSLKDMPYHLLNLSPLNKSEVSNPNKAIFYRMQMFGSTLKNNVVDIKIAVKINNETEVFNFKNVPVL